MHAWAQSAKCMNQHDNGRRTCRSKPCPPHHFLLLWHAFSDATALILLPYNPSWHPPHTNVRTHLHGREVDQRHDGRHTQLVAKRLGHDRHRRGWIVGVDQGV
eukprot:364078-Chlamydomonas_euryale.AAC.8